MDICYLFKINLTLTTFVMSYWAASFCQASRLFNVFKENNNIYKYLKGTTET